MASLGSFTRSAARVTFSAYRRIPIRWRLAGGSAVLTFIILASFAGIVGVLTTRQVRGQFNDEVRSAVDQLQQKLDGKLSFANGVLVDCNHTVHLNDYAQAEQAQIRIFDADTGEPLCAAGGGESKVKFSATTPLGALKTFDVLPAQSGTFNQLGYRVAIENLRAQPTGQLKLLYARPLSDVEHTLDRVQFFLILGVLGGTILALLAGLWSAQRAMKPIAALSEATREIERTRDPSLRIPHPEAEDEVAELARTLEDMLASLDAARADTEAMLERQREFVADASHELRTPLTSVLANLELLAEELRGEQADSAQAALRSTRRMRRLVGDLLLLARADAGRAPAWRAADLGEILTDAAAELGPMADEHDVAVNARPASVVGSRDDLHRVALNLLENAVRHTPPGTHVRAWTSSADGQAILAVEDDGPGIAQDIAQRVFERFVRGGGDGGRGSGLGLAIVRSVAEAHGGHVTLERPAGGGSRFVVRLPLVVAPVSPAPLGGAAPAGVAMRSDGA